MRIAIVNDLLLATEALRRVVTSAPEHQVAWTAMNGAEAVRRCALDRPDLILMDLIMPTMNGVEATRQIMAQSPCAILVVTATVNGNFALVYDAMALGALNAVDTPVLCPGGKLDGSPALLEKIAHIGQMLKKAGSSTTTWFRPPDMAAAAAKLPLKLLAGPPLVAIGASTGGPQALAHVLERFPAEFKGTVVIAQHITADFAGGLVEWLASRTSLKVRLAAAGDRLERGCVYVAHTNDHLVMRSDQTLGYTPEPRENPYRPSVDVLFESLATHGPQKGVAVLLTGIGKDGAKQMLRLRQVGWLTIAQDKKTSVVYGMPQEAAKIGAAERILPINEIGTVVHAHVTTRMR